MQYEISQDAAKVAKDLIRQHHPDLKPKDIRYVMQIRKDAETGEAQQQMRKGKPVFADVKVVGGLNAFLISGEARTDDNGPTPIAVVLISNYAWNKFNQKQREACLDEQLCRLDYDLETGRPTVLAFDANVMTLNVKRYGAWHEDLARMFEASKEMPLFELIKEEPVTASAEAKQQAKVLKAGNGNGKVEEKSLKDAEPTGGNVLKDIKDEVARRRGRPASPRS
jgi:hypothetical protein